MIPTATLVLWCGWGYVGCGALPVWRQGRTGRSAVILAVLVSFVILFASALLLQIAGIRVTRGSWLLTTTILSVICCALPRGPAPHIGSISAVASNSRLVHGALLLSVLVAGSAIGHRAIAQPLTGFDTAFRWDFLARQFVEHGNFGFYPPLVDQDFSRYMWPESIPPLISLLYGWVYLGAASTNPLLTASIVLLIGFSVFVVVWTNAAILGGNRAGWWALALVATSAVHTWAISMGQETGLLTFGLLTMTWALLPCDNRAEPDWVLAGIAAGVTALSRDYGLFGIVIGLIVLGPMGRRWQALTGFLLISLAIAAPWYLRTWWITGNPVYDHNLLGLFPVNAMHAGLMQFYRSTLGVVGHIAERSVQIWQLSWALGAAVVLAALYSLVRPVHWRVVMRVTVVIWIGAWLWSVGSTAGGMSYSLRVLSPVIAVLAIAGGVSLAALPGSMRPVFIAVGLLILAVDGSVRSILTLASPTTVSPSEWLDYSSPQSAMRGDASHDQLAQIIGADRVLVQSVYEHAFLVNRAVPASPVWSPAFAFLQDPAMDAREQIRRLRSKGVRYVLVSSSADLKSYFRRYQLFRDLPALTRSVLVDRYWSLFELLDQP